MRFDPKFEAIHELVAENEHKLNDFELSVLFSKKRATNWIPFDYSSNSASAL